jgi:hypothetical protein
MKYIILALLVITMSFGLVYAQSVFGIKGGMNISRIAGPDAVGSSDSHLGFHMGALIQYNLMKSLVLQPELLYTEKGYNYKYSEEFTNIDYSVHNSFDYIEVPVLIKLNVAVEDIQFQPYLGPAVSYLINGKQKEKLSMVDSGTTVTHENDVADQINKLAFGFAVGAEFVIQKRFIFGGRYNFGLSNVYKDNLDGQGPDVQNGVFMVSLGYLFNK